MMDRTGPGDFSQILERELARVKARLAEVEFDNALLKSAWDSAAEAHLLTAKRLAETVAETDRLNAQALELCAEISGLRRRLLEAERCSANDDGHQCIKPAGHGGSHVV